MTRNKVVSLFLAAVIILAIAVTTFVAVEASQSGLLAHADQGGSNLFSIGVAAPAVRGVLACEGCSAGGGGPV